jgi:hypothetical protein
MPTTRAECSTSQSVAKDSHLTFEFTGPARLFAQVRWNERLELFGKAKKYVD